MFRRKSSSPQNASQARRDTAPALASKTGKGDAIKRSQSLPTHLRSPHVKGILKFSTVDESLHNKYGSDGDRKTNEGDTSDKRAGIILKDVVIREYARTIGDNPSCSSGPPISIAWDYDPESKVLSVDQYEELRPPRRTHFEMVLPRDVRQRMLRREWDVSQQQIAAAVRTNIKVKNQRRATVNNLGKATKMEEALESCTRKLKRGVFFKKSTSQQVQELDQKVEMALKARKQMQASQFYADTEEEPVSESEHKDDDHAPQAAQEAGEPSQASSSASLSSSSHRSSKVVSALMQKPVDKTDADSDPVTDETEESVDRDRAAQRTEGTVNSFDIEC